jgi:hypothetical protein
VFVKIILLLMLAITAIVLYRKWIYKSRQQFLESFQMPGAVVDRFRQKHPALSGEQEALVRDALQQYFQICQRARGRFVAMPSQVVDDLWHDFILFTRHYRNFCSKAFGRFLHHTPVEAMPSPHLATAGIRRTWFHACHIEGINPKQPERLPLLFALDAQLGIANGFFYTLNCANTATSSSNTFCASSIGCGGSVSGCAGDTGGYGSGDSGSDSGGDGGSSCGGGCGGGGGD